MVTNIHIKYVYISFSFLFAYYLYFNNKWSKTDELMPVSNAYISWLAQRSLLLQWLYYTTAAILMPSPYQSRTFASELHTVTAAILFPFSLVVVMLIWTQYLLDPGTQTSKEERRLFAENWSQTAVWPLFAMLVDIFMWQHQRPRLSSFGAKIGPALYSVSASAGLYVFVVRYNLWTYPIFRKIPVVLRPILPMLGFYPLFVAVYPVYHSLLKFRFMRFGRWN
uniref:Androgen-dependent TFPI-regulating protein n=1 Tax=Globodera rostochiensis TaxID=31243 RepID=A0A914H4A5_GLORO